MKKLFTLMLLLMTTAVVSMAQTTWTVAGTAAALNGTTDWAPANAENDMTTADGTVYTLTVEGCTLEKGVTYQYKVVKDHKWDEAYPAQNKTFSVQETAVYTVVYTFNATSKAVSETTTKTGNAGEISHVYSVAGTPASIFGTAWSETSTATEMTLGADGLYAWKKEAVDLPAKTSVEFKVVVDHSWGQAYPDENFVKTIDADGRYDLTFTFNAATKEVGCVVQKQGDVVIESTYVVAGSSEVLFGTAWDATAEANRMEKNADCIWEKSYAGVTLEAGVIEWKVVRNGTEWIPDGMDNNLSIYVPEHDVYTVTFTYDEGTTPKGTLYDKDGKPVVVTPKGEGWPANYGGVMLQGFYWNSFDDTRLTNLNSQVDTLSKYFDLVWLPNTGATGSEGMGYMPVYWFDHNSNFGRERTLRNLIKNFNDHGTKVIEDVVLNHKAPLGKDGSWIDFVNETWTWEGETYEINWSGADICQNDDGGWVKEQGWDVTGANDTGDDFSGGRDLDHTSANVQRNCKLFLDFLLKDLGYSGFRLDMVKGYRAEFTRMYNEHAQPEFCVGEYWDGKEAITNWIAGTGMTSAAFDFPFKYQVKDAFGSGNWSALDYKGICEDTYWQRYAVTFIDNHDTYENEGRLVSGVLGANAFMLAMPGTPCVFLKHWQRYPIAIGNMILARKAAGITNQSPITEARSLDGGYVVKVQGTNGTVLCIAGNVSYDTTGFQLIATGTNFAYFVSDNVKVSGLREGNDDEEERTIAVYVEAAEAPYLYAWNVSGQPVNGSWPGSKLTETATTDDGKTFWKQTFTRVPVNIIFNNGSDVQTANIENITHDSYFTFDATVADKDKNWTDITLDYYTPEPVVLPACATPLPGHLYCYFQGNKDYDSPRAWAWRGDTNFCGEWPGDRLERVGDDGHGHLVWRWDAGEYWDLFGSDDEPAPELLPSNILFSNNGDPQTDDFVFEVGGYYDATGLLANVATGTDAIASPAAPAAQTLRSAYNLQGQKVSPAYRGLIVRDGRKYLRR